MKYEEIKIEYVNSINDIIEKANNFSDIKNLNDYIQDSISKYEELIRTYKNECSSFLVNYDSIKDNHLKMLKIELNKYNLNYELELLKEGNIYSYRKNIENYIKNNKYLDEIAIIIAINVYSSFESIRKDLKKSEYPYLYEFINQKKYSLEFKSSCPICKKNIHYKTFKKVKPSSYDLELDKISLCNCNYPSRYNSIEYIEKINNIINPTNNFSIIKFKNELIKKLKNYTKEKYPNFYKIDNDSFTIYEKEKNFKACNIDKKIWSKIKMNNYNYHDFTFNEQSQLKRIPNALVCGMTFYSLESLIEDLEIIANEKYIEVNNISYSTTIELSINIKDKYLYEFYKVNSQLINFIKNYQKKVPQVEETNQDEILALGYYCKSQKVTINDIDKFIALSNFCNMHNIDFNEIKDLIINNLSHNDDLDF